MSQANQQLDWHINNGILWSLVAPWGLCMCLPTPWVRGVCLMRAGAAHGNRHPSPSVATCPRVSLLSSVSPSPSSLTFGSDCSVHTSGTSSVPGNLARSTCMRFMIPKRHRQPVCCAPSRDQAQVKLEASCDATDINEINVFNVTAGGGGPGRRGGWRRHGSCKQHRCLSSPVAPAVLRGHIHIAG